MRRGRRLEGDQMETSANVSQKAKSFSGWYLMTMGLGALVFLGLIFLEQMGLEDELVGFLASNNYRFYWMLFVGFLAELVAGSMGMGYGVICTSTLLFMNVPPSSISASIHTAESFTSGAGALSHVKLRNVNKKMARHLIIPAIGGAIVGALASSYLDENYAHYLKPFIAIYTIYLGVEILRNYFTRVSRQEARKRTNIFSLGLFGGFIDSFAGGGWGPLVTATFIKNGYNPRYVIGTSTVTNFIITVVSSVTFFIALKGVDNWDIVLGLLIGGIVTAPFSAMLTSRIPVKKLYLVVGGVVVIMGLISFIKAVMRLF